MPPRYDREDALRRLHMTQSMRDREDRQMAEKEQNFDWGAHTAKVIRIKAAELLKFADEIESAKSLEEMHLKSLEALETPCNCTDKEKFSQAIKEAGREKAPFSWDRIHAEYNKILNDRKVYFGEEEQHE